MRWDRDGLGDRRRELPKMQVDVKASLTRPASMSTSEMVQAQRPTKTRAGARRLTASPCPKRNETKPGATRGPAGGICGGRHVCSEYLFLWPVSFGAIFEWPEEEWEKHSTRLALPSSTGGPLFRSEPILRCAEISQQRSGSALVSCTGERPSRWGRGGGWGEEGRRGEVGIEWCLSFLLHVQQVQLAC